MEKEHLPNDELRLLIEALGGQLVEGQGDPTGTVAVLINETLKFRDKLKEETGDILTVGDTRAALDALEEYLHGHALPKNLSPEQRALAQIYIDRITLFRRK
jgi:hypothetical protein